MVARKHQKGCFLEGQGQGKAEGRVVMIELKPDAREDNLPRWAQSKLSVLRTALRSTMQTVAVAKRENAEGSTGLVLADWYNDHGFALHDGAAVKFMLPSGSALCRLRDNKTILDINCDGNLAFYPRAANAGYIRVTR